MVASTKIYKNKINFYWDHSESCCHFGIELFSIFVSASSYASNYSSNNNDKNYASNYYANYRTNGQIIDNRKSTDLSCILSRYTCFSWRVIINWLTTGIRTSWAFISIELNGQHCTNQWSECALHLLIWKRSSVIIDTLIIFCQLANWCQHITFTAGYCHSVRATVNSLY